MNKTQTPSWANASVTLNNLLLHNKELLVSLWADGTPMIYLFNDCMQFQSSAVMMIVCTPIFVFSIPASLC